MTLQQLEVPIIGLDTCKCLYRRNPDPEESHALHNDMMCAGFAEGKKDACQVRPLRGEVVGSATNWPSVVVMVVGHEVLKTAGVLSHFTRIARESISLLNEANKQLGFSAL